MTVKRRTMTEVREAGFEALFRELGYADAARFIHQYDLGRGNYTEERHAWLDNLSLDEVLEMASAYERPGDAPAMI